MSAPVRYRCVSCGWCHDAGLSGEPDQGMVIPRVCPHCGETEAVRTAFVDLRALEGRLKETEKRLDEVAATLYRLIARLESLT